MSKHLIFGGFRNLVVGLFVQTAQARTVWKSRFGAIRPKMFANGQVSAFRQKIGVPTPVKNRSFLLKKTTKQKTP